MTVTCSACAASFPVDPNKIPEGGVKVRCSVCANIFRVERPAPETPASEPEASQGLAAEAPAPESPAAEDVPPDSGVHAGAWDDDSPSVDTARDETAGKWEGSVDSGTGSHLTEDEPMPDWAGVEEPAAAHPDDAEDGARSNAELETEVERHGGPEVEARTDQEPMGWAESASAVAPEITPEPTGWADSQPEPIYWADPEGAETEEAGAPEATEEPAETWPDLPEPSLGQEPESAAEADLGVPQQEAPVQGFTFGKRDPMDKARRLARVLVSDMVMYNSERHQLALSRGTLAEDFEEEIDKSWKEFVEQVGPDIAEGEGRRFWKQALNDILAKGAPAF